MKYAIRNVFMRAPVTGDYLYWSDLVGWVHKSAADLFDSPAGPLPLDGEWVRFVERSAVAKPEAA